MRAARLHEPGGPVVIEEAPVPEPAAGEVRIRIEACGLCHSDLFIRSLPELPRTPLTLGHEAIGIVDETGAEVDSLKAGDRVGLTYLFGSCGACEACLAGNPTLCPRQINTGYHVDGAFAEYAIGRAGHVIKVPHDVDAAAAPLCCAGWTALHAVRSIALPPGSWVAIFGIGGLGSLAVQFARMEGLRVAAVDIVPEKLSGAEELGAEIVVNSATEDPARKLKKEIGGAHAAMTFAASSEVIRKAFGCLRRGGALVLVGLEPKNFDLPLVDVVVKQIRIHGSFLGRAEELRELFEMVRRGKLRLESQACRLEELPAAMERMRAGRLVGRTVVSFPRNDA